eukprot:TRINITY_DN34973_c0_g1_i2.p2 TRINITY_DN34973_c0_g1~~TRINITY_DN34973_c0_g1_i2.p2  ORF type:complete len:120 (+),score=8.04 TRINITY_DN34973_c0_g1_i2:233-592(+)
MLMTIVVRRVSARNCDSSTSTLRSPDYTIKALGRNLELQRGLEYKGKLRQASKHPARSEARASDASAGQGKETGGREFTGPLCLCFRGTQESEGGQGFTTRAACLRSALEVSNAGHHAS